MKKLFEIYGCIVAANFEGLWDSIKGFFKGEDKSAGEVVKVFFAGIIILLCSTFLLIWILSTGLSYYPKKLWKKIKK